MTTRDDGLYGYGVAAILMMVFVVVIGLLCWIKYPKMVAESPSPTLGLETPAITLTPTPTPVSTVVPKNYALGYAFNPIDKKEFLDAFYANETMSDKNYAIGATGWRKNQVVFGERAMELQLSRADSPEEYWHGSEVVSKFETGYGYYEADMKPYGDGPGVVTSFFIYNSASVDEIDVEFNSSFPERVELCYHAKGVSSGGRNSLAFVVELGFDASADYHRYGFYYGPDEVIWYVDGKEVYRTEYAETPEKVSSSCATLFNLWAGGERFANWLGVSDATDKAACVRSVRYIPIDELESGGIK